MLVPLSIYAPIRGERIESAGLARLIWTAPDWFYLSLKKMPPTPSLGRGDEYEYLSERDKMWNHQSWTLAYFNTQAKMHKFVQYKHKRANIRVTACWRQVCCKLSTNHLLQVDCQKLLSTGLVQVVSCKWQVTKRLTLHNDLLEHNEIDKFVSTCWQVATSW